MKRFTLLLTVIIALMLCGCSSSVQPAGNSSGNSGSAETVSPAPEDAEIRAAMAEPGFGSGTKAVVYDCEKQNYSYTEAYIPEDLRAASPEDIGIIVSYSEYEMVISSASADFVYEKTYPFSSETGAGPVNIDDIDGSTILGNGYQTVDEVLSIEADNLLYERRYYEIALQADAAEKIGNCGDRFIAYDEEAKKYSFEIVPPWLRADSVEEIGFVLSYTESYNDFNEVYDPVRGSSIPTNIAGKAKEYRIRVIDSRWYNEEFFRFDVGGEAPMNVTVQQGDYGKAYIYDMPIYEVWAEITGKFLLEDDPVVNIFPEEGSSLSGLSFAANSYPFELEIIYPDGREEKTLWADGLSGFWEASETLVPITDIILSSPCVSLIDDYFSPDYRPSTLLSRYQGVLIPNTDPPYDGDLAEKVSASGERLALKLHFQSELSAKTGYYLALDYYPELGVFRNGSSYYLVGEENAAALNAMLENG